MAILLFATSPATAVIRDDGDDSGVSITGFTTIALFIGIPVLTVLLIVVAIMAPQWSRKAKTELGFTSHDDSWWLNGPATETKALGRAKKQDSDNSFSPKAGGISAKW